MNSTVDRILYDPKSVQGSEPFIPAKRMTNNSANLSNQDHQLIGGQDAPKTDMWTTTTQLQFNGESLENKKHGGKKMLREFEPELFVSPITGEPIANYGNWAETMKQNKSGTNANMTKKTIQEMKKEQDEMNAIEVMLFIFYPIEKKYLFEILFR